jgi:hypothetical protein
VTDGATEIIDATAWEAQCWREHGAAVLAGDVEAAEELIGMLSADQRGRAVLRLYRDKRIGRDVLRAALASAWMHNHRAVREAAGTDRMLQAMFKRAAFDVPAECGHGAEVVRIWRGTRVEKCWHGAAPGRRDQEWFARGESWTTNRDVACWFATRHLECLGEQCVNAAPLVFTMEVHREEIAFWTNQRSEEEVVVFGRRSRARLDQGGEVDWIANGKAWSRRPK